MMGNKASWDNAVPLRPDWLVRASRRPLEITSTSQLPPQDRQEDFNPDTKGVSNLVEVRVVEDELRNILRGWASHPMGDLRVLVLSPYTAQRRLLDAAVRRVRATIRRPQQTPYKYTVDVATVDGSQGASVDWWAEMLPVIPTSPELVLLFVAADLATAWFNAGAQAWHNAGAVTAVGAGGTFPARPEPVELRHITGAILVSLRAFTVSLVQAGLTTASADDGSQASLVLSRIEVQTVADGYALAMASVATREVTLPAEVEPPLPTAAVPLQRPVADRAPVTGTALQGAVPEAAVSATAAGGCRCCGCRGAAPRL
ncbi:hypothetical protein I4F81_012480 [Pyropia yezoensis]|uniref:Uncharacterized protein n=1 Tax=Pyropia yezoensis TaxID=2788 RepID=A0ACC3CIA7_PYRYE|nr:hypothetical protein I4F81_012480 [Neopyropia yezoensis]